VPSYLLLPPARTCAYLPQDTQRRLEEAAEQRDREREQREREAERSMRLESEVQKEKLQLSQALTRIGLLEDQLAGEQRMRGEERAAASHRAAEEAAALRSALAEAEQRAADSRSLCASEEARLACGNALPCPASAIPLGVDPKLPVPQLACSPAVLPLLLASAASYQLTASESCEP
jgi:hypothetical protein